MASKVVRNECYDVQTTSGMIIGWAPGHGFLNGSGDSWPRGYAIDPSKGWGYGDGRGGTRAHICD